MCYFCNGVNPPKADECFYQPVGGPREGALQRDPGGRFLVPGRQRPSVVRPRFRGLEEYTWEADRLRDYDRGRRPDVGLSG